MTSPENPYFARVWKGLLVGAGVALLLGFLPATHALAVTIAKMLFGVFIGAEMAAPGTLPGQGGTMTNFVFQVIPEMWPRVALGGVLSVELWWLVSPWLGGLFLLWLPWHYSGLGPNFIDRALAKVGIKTT